MTETPTPPRRPYQKPTVTRVKLRPEEAVLGQCKTGAMAGPLDNCAVGNPCFDTGS